jgi:hypothetical protein
MVKVVVITALIILGIGGIALYRIRKKIQKKAFTQGIKEGIQYGNEMGNLHSLENGVKSNDGIGLNFAGNKGSSDAWGGAI